MTDRKAYIAGLLDNLNNTELQSPYGILGELGNKPTQHEQNLTALGRLLAPGLTDYLTKPAPPPSYEPNMAGKIPPIGYNPYEGGALWDMFNLATMAVPMGGGTKAAMVAAPMAARLMKSPFTLTAYRGGSTPLRAAEIGESIPGTGRYEFYAHTNPDIAREYGTVSEMRIDPSKFFDARTEEGLRQWKAWGQRISEAEKAGYKGAIYPDPHDWGGPIEGHEIVIFDPKSLRLRADK